VHRYSPELSSHDLRLPEVEPDPHVDPEVLDRFDNGGGTPDGVARIVKAGEEAIARGVELSPAVTPQLAAD
jgi:hypothetical protein